MSVFRNIGFRPDGVPFGVDPGAFLWAAFSFWGSLRAACFEEGSQYRLPAFGFAFRRKSGDSANQWGDLGEYLSFPYVETYSLPGHPVPASMWSTSPDFPALDDLDESGVLGDTVIPSPYASRFRDVMRPDWPEQRYKLIRLTRYALVPLELKIGGEVWLSGFYPGSWIDWAWTRTIEAAIPAYWQQATSRKIGINGQEGKPISGNSWQGDAWSFTYSSGELGQYLWLYGAADLATHPDFAQYFDI